MMLSRPLTSALAAATLALGGIAPAEAATHRGVESLAAHHSAPMPRLPGGGTEVFAKKRFLFAHYGFAHPSSTFILGQRSPDRDVALMRRQGARFVQRGEQLLPVYELVVTIADADPGTDGNYNHDLLHSKVQEYIDAAHRNKALLLLDLQPGRESFLDVAKRWEWALTDPWVGLGLDTEWRMRADEVPGTDIGSVSASELNQTSAWLARLVRRERLPQKVFLWHQFRTGNVRGIKAIKQRRALATVQHIDASGSPGAKSATYAAVAQPRRFTTGFMVFLSSDSPRMKPAAIRRLNSSIRFVSYQ